ncbi:MAG TPA: ion channel [Gallionella sp.]|nr:ion channel [Gallionella sp.]
MKFIHLLGMAGIDAHERVVARQWGKRLEWPMLLIALWIPFQWYLEETESIPLLLGRIADWLVWLMFVFETVLLASLVNNRRRYLTHNWMNVLIICASVPLIWHYTPLAGLLRSLRLFMVVVLLARMSKTMRKLLAYHQLGATMMVAFITTLLSGVIITRLDPSIGSAWDGMWWAWVTMSSVGYGDVVPASGAGRVFGAVLILFGVMLVSLLTANLSAFIIGSDVKKVEREEQQVDAMLKDITARLERIEQKLAERSADKDAR